ncbi:MAG: HPr family phosphocarrier protein [Planctomycetota bacterium]|jgi:phosphotransferase system HPr (HPr) family protein
MATVTSNVVITYELGVHARPATAFTVLAARFESAVTVSRADAPDAEVDGKAMLGMLTLAITSGTEIRIRAAGHDAQEAVDALVALVRADFAEDSPGSDR